MSRTSPPPPPMYYTPDGAKSVNDVGGGKIWTVEDEDDDDEKMTGMKQCFSTTFQKRGFINVTVKCWFFKILWLFLSIGIDELDDEETRILLEKEFDDFYEDQVHKSAGIFTTDFRRFTTINLTAMINIHIILKYKIRVFQVLLYLSPKCLVCYQQYGRKRSQRVNANPISTFTHLSFLLVSKTG